MGVTCVSLSRNLETWGNGGISISPFSIFPMNHPSTKGKLVMKFRENFVESWQLYTQKERRNVGIYSVGIILYRFGLEVFNGSIITLAVDLYFPNNTFEKLGALVGVNQVMQLVGALLIVRFLFPLY
jgi:hypothetical protein